MNNRVMQLIKAIVPTEKANPGYGPNVFQEWGMKNIDSTFRVDAGNSRMEIIDDVVVIRGTCSYKVNGRRVSKGYVARYDMDGSLISYDIN